jgi:hypothetical protein
MTGFRTPANPSPDELLDIAVGEILEANSPYAYSTLTAVERFLRQFQMLDQLEVHEVLANAYLSGKKQIQQGVLICNPHAWLKRKAFELIRQEHESRARLAFMKVKSSAQSCILVSNLPEQLSALWQALATLAEDDPKTIQLLAWRVLDGLSWQAIQHRLTYLGETAPSDVVLRRRAIRAKKHLRRVFHACQSGKQ